MSQADILSILERCKKPMASSEIAKELQDNCIHVSHGLAKLVKYGDIKVVEINRKQALERYKCKHRMRLYYV